MFRSKKDSLKDIEDFFDTARRITADFSTNYAAGQIATGQDVDIVAVTRYGCQRMAKLMRDFANHLDKYVETPNEERD